MNTSTPAWTPVLPEAELNIDQPRVYKGHGKQIALFRLEDGGVFAIDNRCPHEGYPLAQGYVKGCLLTCAWHNFKFDLRDGQCVMGDEAVRSFPVRVRDGQIELDLADPDPGALIPGLMASLHEGLADHSMGRVVRDAARLLKLGVPPEQLAAEAATFDARHAEYGATHALAVSADVLGYLPRYPGLRAALPLAQAFDIAGESNKRLPARVLPEPIPPEGTPAQAGERLRERVETEEAADAQALVRGALQLGWGRAELEPWFFRLCADHFLDFGHQTIYTSKVFDFLDKVGWHHADPILVGLVFGIVNGTREDTLPKWAGWQKRRLALRPRLSSLYHPDATLTLEGAQRQFFVEAVVDGTDAQATEAVVDALSAGVSLLCIARLLVVGASHRVMRFDLRHDADPTVQNNWLDVTHALTFADALTRAVVYWSDPGVLELLLQGARFVNHLKPLDMQPEDTFDLSPLAGAQAALMQAIDAKQTQQALRLAAGLHAAGGDMRALRHALEDRAIQEPAVRPIFISHHIKATVAVFDQYEALEGDPDQALPLLAAVRFLASPAHEPRLGRIIHDAIAFVESGRTPRILT